MTESATDPAILDAVELLARYSFDLGTFASEQLVDYWLRRYPANWVRAAVIEALYQGRYKAVSVGQILAIWGRRGQPIYHYNSEFERIVSDRYLTLYPTRPNAPTEGAGEVAVDDDDSAPADSQEGEGAIAHSPQPEPKPLDIHPPDLKEDADFQANWATSEQPETLTATEISPTFEPTETILLESLADFPLIWQEQPPSQPEIELHAGSPEIWVHGDVRKHPIHRFVPDPEGSWFYIKLRAVAYDDEFPLSPADFTVGQSLRSHR